jgi:hypothetical protein
VPVLIFLAYPMLLVGGMTSSLGALSGIISLAVMLLYLYALSCSAAWLYEATRKRTKQKVEYVYEEAKK